MTEQNKNIIHVLSVDFISIKEEIKSHLKKNEIHTDKENIKKMEEICNVSVLMNAITGEPFAAVTFQKEEFEKVFADQLPKKSKLILMSNKIIGEA